VLGTDERVPTLIYNGYGAQVDRLHRLEAVLPRHGQPQRRAELVEQRLAVDAGDPASGPT
jgi:hypothetical protein